MFDVVKSYFFQIVFCSVEFLPRFDLFLSEISLNLIVDFWHNSLVLAFFLFLRLRHFFHFESSFLVLLVTKAALASCRFDLILVYCLYVLNQFIHLLVDFDVLKVEK